jgi:DNA repair protein RecN (Recombination protein N)
LGRIKAESRSVLGECVVNLAVLRELGELLVDVHGQSEHLSLLRVRQHIDLLDRFAGVEAELTAYQQIYRRLQALRKELIELRLAESEAARQIDLLSYQANEIETAHLKAGEEEDLIAERIRLANAESLANLAQQALIGLDEGSPESPSVLDLLGQVEDAVNGLARIDPSQESVAATLQAAYTSLTEVSRDLRSFIDNIEFNPQRLDQVEERLNLIHTLKRKYGESILLVLEFAARARQQIESITHAGERITELESQEKEMLVELGTRGLALSQNRHRAASQLQTEMENELADLRMEGARFKVDFQERSDPDGVLLPDERRLAFDLTGLERVEFLIAPNPGEGLKPLVKIASGGETSRLMLALKNVLANADHIPTLIFDEIDQGIGRVGTILGRNTASGTPPPGICVTHLHNWLHLKTASRSSSGY